LRETLPKPTRPGQPPSWFSGLYSFAPSEQIQGTELREIGIIRGRILFPASSFSFLYFPASRLTLGRARFLKEDREG